MTLLTDTGLDVDPQEVESAIRDAVDEASERIVRLSQEIGRDPELAFQEHRAAARVAATLHDSGFAVTTGVYGLDTAVEAIYGSGEMTVAVVGEYDALPGVGHACGHNVIAAAGVGAAVGLAAVADRLGLRVKFLGTPAEELGGGKILMLEAGAWDDAAFSLMVHGGPFAQIASSGFVTQAYERIIATFHGRAAHAAAMPHEGVNAGDAVTLAQVGLGLLRQQLRRTVVVGSFVVEAGGATNVIPERGVLEVEIRGNTADEWRDARKRVRDVLAGAALASGCRVEIDRPEKPYAPLDPDADISRFFDEAMTGMGYDLLPAPAGMGGGSTDMGNVSQYLPSIHPMIALRGVEAVPHHQSFAEAAVSSAGDIAAVDGALALALAAARAASDTVVRARLIDAQRTRAPYAPEPEDDLG
ncbi:amidohydrolase [Microbacterium trichothecenolyticum]|uniref:M20 family metallopeptidase n=1 Tax=Microbacterium trichothecenolyticum TaxID=69370 RepID=UPI00285B19E5|nr:M20 family metallopeptidase [Microbacterium trichothecenolyticum]MDR7184104.1 amidohydrolase [Microbacterium trichothecenolyticum]